MSDISLTLPFLQKLLNQEAKCDEQAYSTHNDVSDGKKLVLRAKEIRLRNHKILLSTKATNVII